MKVTPDIKQRIITMGKQSNAREIGKVLGLSTMTVWRHMNDHKPVLQSERVRFHQRKKNVRAGFFNESEHENWLV